MTTQPLRERLTSTLSLTVATTLALMALSSVAQAQAWRRGPSDVDRARDASSSRGMLTSHAETLDQGDWTVDSYQIFLAGLSLGITDDAQLSLTTLVPVTRDMPLLGVAQLKLNLLRSSHTVVSVALNGAYGADQETPDEFVGTFGGSLLVDQFIDPRGVLSVHGGLTVNGALANGNLVGDDTIEVGDGAVVMADVGVTARLSHRLKLMGEMKVPLAVTNGQITAADPLVTYGMRFHGESLSADLGFIRPINDADDELLLGLPYVALSARF